MEPMIVVHFSTEGRLVGMASCGAVITESRGQMTARPDWTTCRRCLTHIQKRTVKPTELDELSRRASEMETVRRVRPPEEERRGR